MKRLIDDLNRRFRRSGTAVGGLAAAATLVVAGCGSSHSQRTTTARPATSPTVATAVGTIHRTNLITIMQADGELDDLQASPATTIAGLAQLGASTIRTIVYWNNFAPDADSRTAPKGFKAADPAAYAPSVWRILDGADRQAAVDHVTLFVTLDGGNAPLWATAPGAPTHGVDPDHWKPSAADYEQWVKALGLRYSGHYTPRGQSTPLPRIHFWSIWNEPNLGVEIAPVTTGDGTIPSNAAQYRKLVAAGWDGLAATGHTTHTDTILIGETAPRGSDQPTQPAAPMAPLTFIRALYCVDSDFKPLHGNAAAALDCPTTAAAVRSFAAHNPALFTATGWADHPYPDGGAPTDNTQPQGTTGYADFANLGSLISTLDRATGAYGQHPKFPIYNTEFGYAPTPAGPYPQLTPAKAALYLNEAEYLSWSNPRIVSYDQYEWHDPPPPQTFTTGLYSYGTNAPKATLPAFLMPLYLPKTSAAKGSALQVWGCGRQAAGYAVSVKKPQQIAIQLSTDGGTTFKTIKTITLDPARDGCYFDTQVTFPASGQVRTLWDGNGTPTYSRIQAITLS